MSAMSTNSTTLSKTDLSTTDDASSGLPPSLQRQLLDFRGYVWRVKVLEVVGLACLGMGLAFLSLFLLDRWIDTSIAVRSSIAALVILAWLTLPWAFHRWVWSFRRPEQLAQLIRKQAPMFGDELLGVIELANNPAERERSPVLCEAAIRQVAERASGLDLLANAPSSGYRRWLSASAGIGGVVALLFLFLPQPTWNAWRRLLTPWQAIDRYTFARLEPLPKAWVVPHGEAVAWTPQLKDDSPWLPVRASVRVNHQPAIYALRAEQHYYPFELPPLNRDSVLDLRVGDFTQRIAVQPKWRPELTQVRARVRLPEYLGQPPVSDRDVRSGSLSVVVGSQLELLAEVNRRLAVAELDRYPASSPGLIPNDGQGDGGATAPRGGQPFRVTIAENRIESQPISVEPEPSLLALTWADGDGLTSRQPFQLSVQAVPDGVPLVAAEGLAAEAIVLNTEQLNFQLVANDDFGIKEVGLSWRVASEQLEPEPPATSSTEGADRALAAGGVTQASLHCPAAFRPVDWGIESQWIELRAWAVDYFPDRPRRYSAPYRFLVLRPDEHAVWLTEQLNQWQQQSLDVRDRELQLHQLNRELRELSGQALALPENQQRIQQQATAEAANARRLQGLLQSGEGLLRQASRNSEFGVGHLERWAEVLETLQAISQQRMPKVTDLLKQASQAVTSLPAKAEDSPVVGEVRTSIPGAEGAAEPAAGEQAKQSPLPKLVDVESSMQPPDKASAAKAEESKSAPSKLGLPGTVLIGPPEEAAADEPTSAEEKLEAAIEEQAELLAEFDRLAEELSGVLGELEGSTLVKRLKAASREQLQVAQAITGRLEEVLLNRHTKTESSSADSLGDLSQTEAHESDVVSNIMDDLEAFQERRRLAKFRQVLVEMKESEVVSSLRQLGDELNREQGLSIAQAEYWADTLDRWAEDLVDPAGKGNCPGSKDAHSLPPSLILEVLQILEGQVNLREQTRVVEQGSDLQGPAEHAAQARELGQLQSELQLRTDGVRTKMEGLPDGAVNFSDEIERLTQTGILMTESIDTFRQADTGSNSLAIQTEIIETLLQSNRINPKASGGGSGRSPGGGGQGEASDAALALLGSGLNLKGQAEFRETSPATGSSGAGFPEEFRDGLNRYFNLLEQETPRTGAAATND
jgi:hypothetical protein